MAYYHALQGVPPTLKSDMDAVLNKKLGTTGQSYPSSDWAKDVNIMGLLPEKTASGAVASFSDGADAVPIKSATFDIDPTLDGVSSVGVVHCGKNVIDNPLESGTSGVVTYTVNSDKSVTFNGTPTQNTYVYIYGAYNSYADLGLKAGTYYLSGGTADAKIFFIRNRGGTTYNYQNDGSNTTQMDIQDGDTFRVYVRLASGVTLTNETIYLMVSVQNDDTYEKYTSDTRTILLDTTVYGGSVTVADDGDVTLTSGNWKNVDLGSYNYTRYENASISGTYYYRCNVTDRDTSVSQMVADGYTLKGQGASTLTSDKTFAYSATQGYLYFRDDAIEDKDAFKTAVTGSYLTYCSTVTPTESTLDPVTPIQTKLGVNNIWCDTGDVSELIYRQMGTTVWEGKKSTTAWSTPITFNEFDASDYEYIMLTFHAWKDSTEYQYVDLPIKVSDIKKNAEYQTADDATRVVYEGSGSTLYSLYVRRDLNEVFYVYASTNWSTSIQMIKGA